MAEALGNNGTFAAQPDAAPIAIWTAGSTLPGVRAALRETPGATIETDHGHVILERIEQGALQADLVLLPDAMLDRLSARGLIVSASRRALGVVPVGAAVRADEPLPDVSTLAALVASVRVARSVGLTLAPSGVHLSGVFEQLGVMDAIAPRLARFDKASELNAAIAATHGMIGFAPATEIIAWRDRGLAYAGHVPREIQMALGYGAAMLTAAANGGACAQILEILSSEPAQQAFTETGVEPRAA